MKKTLTTILITTLSFLLCSCADNDIKNLVYTCGRPGYSDSCYANFGETWRLYGRCNIQYRNQISVNDNGQSQKVYCVYSKHNYNGWIQTECMGFVSDSYSSNVIFVEIDNINDNNYHVIQLQSSDKIKLLKNANVWMNFENDTLMFPNSYLEVMCVAVADDNKNKNISELSVQTIKKIGEENARNL